MYLIKLKQLREDNEYTQKEIADILKTKRSTYNNWERGDVMIPFEIADKLSVF